MNFRTQVVLLMMMTAIFTSVMAQENDPAAQADPGERECIPAAEAEQSSGEESGPTGEQDGDADAALPTCEELAAGEAETDDVPPPAPAEPDDETGDGPGDDVDDEDFGREFEPTDEISEDYPIPLPSDI